MPMPHEGQILKAFSADVSVDEGERAVTATITTSAVDRDGEVVMPRGLDIRDFEKNPLVYLGHNYYELPVGQCVGIKRTDDAIIAKTVFASRPENHPADAEWVPDTLFALYQQKVLRGFSIGFVPIESRPATQKDVEKFGAGVKRVYSKATLYEYSVAPLPANPQAIALAVSKGWLSKSTAAGVFNFHSSGVDVTTLKYTIESETKSKQINDVVDAVRKARGALYYV